jgi:hypothetical protein
MTMEQLLEAELQICSTIYNFWLSVLNRPISLNRNPTGCSKECIFSSSWIFLQEEELRFRRRSWRVNAGAEPLRSNDPLYPSFRPAGQA